MRQRKKILMLTTQLGYGGAETSFIRLANFLAQTMDVTVALFTSDYGMDSYAKDHEPLNATIILLDSLTPCGRLRRWWQRIRAVRKLKQGQDVTISFLSGPNLVNVLAGYNARSIVSLRGSRVYDPVAPKRQRLLFQHLLDPLIFRLAKCIVPVSAGLRYEIPKYAQAKIQIIPPFIDLQELQQKLMEPVPEPYTALKNQPVIIGVGRLSVEKGFQHLIRVFAAMAEQRIGTKLLLVGDGPLQPQLRAQCTALGLVMDDTTPGKTSVLFAGYQKNIMPFMRLACVFALTSATEGFPSVLLEAMLTGVPVVAADTPWGARTILDGATAAANPYPTLEPSATRYGVLMPRIDKSEHQASWVGRLSDYVTAPQPLPDAASTRPADFAIAVVGEQWRTLIEGIADAT